VSITVFPPLQPTSSSVSAVSYTIPEASKTFKIERSFVKAVYSIQAAGGSITANFFDSTLVLDPVSSSGTTTYNLASDVDGFFVVANTSNVVVTITFTALTLPGNAISGTVDTITNSGTYNQTGLLYVIAFGGGGAGGTGSIVWGGAGGGGGGSGFKTEKLIITNSATNITIGAAGVNSGTSGGQTSFGNLVLAGGGNGASGATGGNGGGRGAQASGSSSDNHRTSTSIGASNTDFLNGTTGGGGGGVPLGYSPNVSQAPSGSGIGGGGAGGNASSPSTGNNGSPATGYGAGGGGGANGYYVGSTRNGGSGSPGVVYVLRGF